MNPVHPTSSKAAWPSKAQSPGEPLFTLAEIATQLGVPMMELIQAMRHGDVLRPWQVHNQTRNLNKRVMYRMSDAKRWFAGLGGRGEAV